jgi:hypothetical protein
MSEESRRLVPLGETREYHIASMMPDVRGWDVIGPDGVVLGRVTELMVDPRVGRVRYLEMETRGADGLPERRVHVPIGLARIDEQRDVVLVPTITTTALSSLTTSTPGSITREYEIHVRRSIVGAEEAGVGDVEEAGFYDSEHYDERRFAAPRRPGRAEGERDADADDDEDFGYLAGVGGAMTQDDEHPDVVGEVDAGQISVPVMEEESDHPVAPEDRRHAGGAERPEPDRRG